jgi:hypothetical protein
MKKSIFLTVVVLMLIAVSFWVYNATVDKASSRNDALYRNLICGEWKQVDVRCIAKSKSRLPEVKVKYSGSPGYVFRKDGSCENKLGFYYRNFRFSDLKKRQVFYGTESVYKIKNSYLKIYDPSDSIWHDSRIIRLTKDTLLVEPTDSVQIVYTKMHYELQPAKQFDKIVMSVGSMIRAPMVSNIVICKEGDVLLESHFGNLDGYYSSKISTRYFYQLESNFRKANIDKMKTEYTEDAYDVGLKSVSVVYNHKVYKTIRDYGRQAPLEFQWATIPVMMLSQTLKLQKVSRQDSILLSHWVNGFYQGKKLIRDVDGFYLLSELRKSKKVNHTFKSIYQLKSESESETDRQIIATDGRYYRIMIDNKPVTYDLGYNWLE